MTQTMLDQLFEILGEIVSAPGNYREKQEAILEYADEDNKTTLFEFVSWFPEE